ncbi:hypothetical protein QCA50_011076 [Cerrena zonata]|uniref:Rhodanese domain-containing protein n=1 Tax=Cerrena zonata TaxID=2478898 RepID=A0AAW0FXT4_9APHY
MPGVTVLPPSPAISGFGHHHSSKMQNGSVSSIPSYETVSDIKSAAIENVRNATRGASATSLLNAAKSQIGLANVAENEGSLKDALTCFIKAATLVSMCMESNDYKQELKKHGVLHQQVLHFQLHEGANLLEKVQEVESKLSRALAEASHSPKSEDAPQSLADRMRKLRSAGMDVSSAGPVSKRISKDLSINLPPSSSSDLPVSTAPSLPSVPSAPPTRSLLQGLPSPLPSTSSSLASPAATSSKLPSPHTLIPASSFGPPSPTSSPPESPLDGANFRYPSIDELNRRDGLQQPSTSSSIPPAPAQPSPLPAPIPSFPIPSPAFPIPRPAFPALPLDHAPRPSSTPIPPTIDTFISRPGSPAISSPLSPTVPRKPSNLGLNKASRSPLIPNGVLTPAAEKGLPFTALFPKTLHECMQRQGFQVLLLDVRNRDAFERERIKGDEVVCIEPSVLRRENITADAIEDALVVGSRNESTLFSNRDKFDLIAMYDEDSTNPNSSPAITALQRAIYETSFRKILKNMPMLLIGGLKAWKEEFGVQELFVGASASSTRLGGPSSVRVGFNFTFA